MKTKKIIISVICVLVVLILLFSIIGIQVTSATTSRMFAKTGVEVTDIDYEKEFTGDSRQNLSAENHAGENYVKQAETEYLELYLKVDDYRLMTTDYETGELVMDPMAAGKKRYDIAVYDKASKKLWTGLVPDDKIDYANLNEALTSQMQSLVLFSYYDVMYGNNEAIDVSPMGTDVASEISTTSIPNGVRISYNFPQYNVGFSIDFKIYGDCFDVVIPEDQIKESLQNTSKITEARKAAESLVKDYQKLLGQFNENKLKTGVAEDDDSMIRTLKSNRRAIEASLKSLSDQSLSGGNTLSSVKQLEENTLNFTMAIRRYDENGVYDDLIDQIQDIMDLIKSKFDDVDSNTLAGLVDIDVLPYFGAADTKEDGYVFYPDKAGAISYFNEYHPQAVSFIEQDFYSNHKTDIDTYLDRESDEEDIEKEKEEFTTFQMPVYGVKNGNSAFLAVIAEGDMDAGLNYTPATETIAVNHIWPIFHMRNITQNTKSDGTLMDVIDDKLIDESRRIRYYFLGGDQADYAGMAVKYRQHLEKYGLLNTSKYMEAEDVPLFIQFYMGMQTTTTSVLPEYQKLTSYEDIQKILADLKSKGVGTINTSLTGWSTAGNNDVLPDYDLKPEGKLGGKNALKDLTAYASGNNASIALDNSFLMGYSDVMTSTHKDSGTTKNYGGFTVGSGSWMLFNPTVAFNMVKDAVPTMKNYGIQSLTFAREGIWVYNDYNDRAPYSRRLMLQTMQQMIKNAKDEVGTVNLRKPNVYMASVSDWFMDFLEDDSKMMLSDKGVPFYQMVIHGSVVYTGTAQNLFHEETHQSLQAIEYGYVPYYLLTHDEVDSKTNYMDLYSTQYSQWSDKIVESYKTYNEKMGDLWKAKMTDHEEVSEGLVCVTYDTGARVLVNYNDTAKEYDGIKVDATSYEVVK